MLSLRGVYLQEFHLNGSTAEEQAARAQKAAERKQRIIEQMHQDQYTLKELRWPYVSSRAPVHPTPPPMIHLQQSYTLAEHNAEQDTVENKIGNLTLSGNYGSRSPTRKKHNLQGSNSVGNVNKHHDGYSVGETLSAQLRAEVVRQARAAGKYDSQEER